MTPAADELNGESAFNDELGVCSLKFVASDAVELDEESEGDSSLSRDEAATIDEQAGVIPLEEEDDTLSSLEAADAMADSNFACSNSGFCECATTSRSLSATAFAESDWANA